MRFLTVTSRSAVLSLSFASTTNIGSSSFFGPLVVGVFMQRRFRNPGSGLQVNRETWVGISDRCLGLEFWMPSYKLHLQV